jgi:hypothetical protein
MCRKEVIQNRTCYFSAPIHATLWRLYGVEVANSRKEDEMFIRKTVSLLLMVLCMATVIHAQSKGTIVFAYRTDLTDPVTSEPPDMTWIHLLEDTGYDVIQFYNASLSTAEQATLDTLNNANLVIIGRSVPTTTLGGNSAADKVAWNGITAPILTGNMWAMRSSRLNWFSTTTINGPLGDSITVYNATIYVTDDPVFEGLDTSTPVPWATGPIDALGITADASGGLVLAVMEVDPFAVLYARFEPYEEFYGGSGDYPSGYRTYIGNGRDASSQPPFNYFPFTEESKKVLLAEVARMVVLGGGPVDEVGEITTAPSTFVLSQNYPNPFNPTTKIAYAVPTATEVLLEVFDVLGRKVATLVDETKQPGEYSVEFDASSLVSGVYMYRMTTPKTSITNKMVLVK